MTMDISRTVNVLRHVKTFGSSMEPLLHDGDIVFFRKVSFTSLRVDDVVVVKEGARFVTHRIIFRSTNLVITKGDNNTTADGKKFPRHIIGRVYQIRRGDGTFPLETLYLLQSGVYRTEIARVLAAIGRAKVPCILLKGLPLHLYYEKKIPRRVYADCDLMVPDEYFPNAEGMLLSLGYQYHEQEFTRMHTWLRKGEKQEKSYYKIVNNVPIVFDLHREPVFQISKLGHLDALYPKKKLDSLTRLFFSQKRRIVVQDTSFLILQPAHQVVYLALHLLNHNFQGAFRYQFLDTVYRREYKKNPKLAEEMKELISQFRLEKFVCPGLILLKKYYKTPVPESMVTPFVRQDPYIRRLVKEARIFDDTSTVSRGIQRFITLFQLSPVPLWRRMFVFLNPSVAGMVLWLMVQIVKRPKTKPNKHKTS